MVISVPPQAPAVAPDFDRILVARERELCDLLGRLDSQEAADLGVERANLTELAAVDPMAMVEETQAELAAHELQEVQAARARLQHHTFGTCRDCGDPIDAQRLALLPFASCCTECQARHERRGASPGRGPAG
jgi:RNA polymerase-binding transcription factor DksA